MTGYSNQNVNKEYRCSKGV